MSAGGGRGTVGCGGRRRGWRCIVRKGVAGMWLAGLVLACAGQAAPATRPMVIEPTLAPEGHVDQMVVRGVVGQWNEVQVEARAVAIDDPLLKKIRWEVRSADEMRRVGRVDLHWEYVPVRSVTSPAMRVFTGSAAAKLGEGSFVAAWVLENQRVSNVMAVQVDKKHLVANEAALVAMVAEPALKGSLPLVAVGVVRRAEEDPAWKPIDLLGLRVTIDGVTNAERMAYSGGNRPMAVGEARATVRTLDGWKGTWEPGQARTVSLGRATTVAEVKSDLSTPLGDAWDAATGKLAELKEGAAP